MAWNQYYVFVKSPGQTPLEELLTQLGLGAYKPIREATLDDTNKPSTLFAGLYNDALVIVHPKLPFAFYGLDTSDTEKRFAAVFPHSEIAALVMNESVYMFGYALLTNGRKVRMKDGADGEIYHDMGELLPEEQSALAGEIYSKEELAEFKADGETEAQLRHRVAFEASFRVPYELTRRFLGENVLRMDTSKVKLTMYSDK